MMISLKKFLVLLNKLTKACVEACEEQNNIMKTIIVTIATIFVSLAGFAEKAEARSSNHPVGHSYVYKSGYTSCGCVIYTKRVIIGYDCYHRPIYKYYKVPVSHRCGGYCGTSYYKHSKSKPHFTYARRSGHRGVTTGHRGSIRIRR